MIIRAGSRTVFRRSLLHALAFSPFPCRNASQGSGTSAAAAPFLFLLSSCPARREQAALHPSNRRLSASCRPATYLSLSGTTPRTGQNPFSKRESSEKGKSFREKPRKKPCPFRTSKEFDRHIISGLLDGKADAQPEFVFVPVLANESAHAQIPGSHIVVHIVFLNGQIAVQQGKTPLAD